MGFTVAIAVIGTVFGALLAGIPGERYGARECLKVVGVFFFVSSIGCALAWSWHMLLVARFIGGLAIGSVSVMAPVYIAEISPARWRGRLVGLFQCSIVSGILVAYLSNYLIDLADLGDLDWRIKLGSGALPALLFFSLLFGIPRSPRWLMKKGQAAEARQVLFDVGEEISTENWMTLRLHWKRDGGGGECRFFPEIIFSPFFLLFLSPCSTNFRASMVCCIT